MDVSGAAAIATASSNRIVVRRVALSGSSGTLRQKCIVPDAKETLPSTEFVGHIWRKNGLQPQCRLCQRVKKYGLTKSTWLDLLNAQNYQCASCEIELAVESTHQANSPHVDHDHATGDVRGILCAFCNAALGFVKDDPQILHGLIRYLGYASRTSQQEAETA